MKDDRTADRCMANYFRPYRRALVQFRVEAGGNFGYWCLFDENIFCQEREGCHNCMIMRRRAP